MDFVRPSRPIDMSLVAGRGHYESVLAAVREARTSLWIATANLKELMVEDLRWTSKRRANRPGYRSVIGVFDELVSQGVELRLLHASPPSRPFRAELKQHPSLGARSLGKPRAGLRGTFEMRLCPRVHLKAVIVDGRFLYLGSANWTGAGLGAKGAGRRNFELGFVTDDALLLDDVQALFDGIWRGSACAACALKAECPAPLDGVDRARRARVKETARSAAPGVPGVTSDSPASPAAR